MPIEFADGKRLGLAVVGAAKSDQRLLRAASALGPRVAERATRMGAGKPNTDSKASENVSDSASSTGPKQANGTSPTLWVLCLARPHRVSSNPCEAACPCSADIQACKCVSW